MTHEMLDSGPTLTPEDIGSMEERTGRKVPTRYRQFLLKYNGGSPEPCNFSYADPRRDGAKISGAVESFLGIGVDEHSQIEWHLQTLEGRIPNDLYPIADDPGGNMLCMRVDDSTTPGEIVFWDHEEEAEEGEPPTQRNLYHVADNLDELLDRLQ